MFKDIIVELGLGPRDVAGSYALSLGEKFRAHVLGVAINYAALLPGSIMAEALTEVRAEIRGRANNAVARFNEEARRRNVPAGTLILDDGAIVPPEELGALARRFDLAVFGQPEDDFLGAEQAVAEALLFDSGRPVLVVPYIYNGEPKFDRITVCWDGSRSAARAVADAMPLLKKAKAVDVVIVGTVPPKSDETSGADLGQHLARHGLSVEVKRITSPDVDVANTILSHVADNSTDMLVMGAYGHSRLREFILGGATRGILQAMTVPTLMSH